MSWSEVLQQPTCHGDALLSNPPWLLGIFMREKSCLTFQSAGSSSTVIIGVLCVLGTAHGSQDGWHKF